MMETLFKNKEAIEVVSAQDVKNLTGISSDDFHFKGEDNEDDALNELLENWIAKIASHIYVRINRSIEETDGEFLAIQDVLVRTVANVVAVAQQQRTSPVVQIDSFAINILNTSEVTSDLDRELEPFVRGKNRSRGRLSVFSSSEEFEEDGY